MGGSNELYPQDRRTTTTSSTTTALATEETLAEAVAALEHLDAVQGNVDDVAWVSGDGTIISLLKKIAGGTGGGGAVTIADGADTVLGALADAAITTDIAGTINAKLRGLIKILADVWDDAADSLKVKITNASIAVTAAALPLPTGAATEATLAQARAALGTPTDAGVIGDNDGSIDAHLRGINTLLDRIIVASGNPYLGYGTHIMAQDEGSGNSQQLIALVNGSRRPLAVGIIDSSGNQIDFAGIGGGTQYDEDTPVNSGDKGNLMLAIRNDGAANGLTNADGDYSGIAVDEFGKLFVDISANSIGLATEATLGNVATEASLVTRLSEAVFNTLIGALTETAPGTDTASSGLNGRLQRIAQRLTTLITNLGSPFQAGGSIGNTTFGITNWLGSTAPTVGQKTKANSVPVVIASDQDTLAVSLASVPSHAVTNAGVFAVQDSEKLADNTGFTDGTTKVNPIGLIFDETPGTALTENDIAAPRIDSKRAQVIVHEDSVTRGLRQGVVDETGINAVDAAAMGGGTPNDSVDSGNPIKIGFKAYELDGTAPQTPVAEADRVNAISDLIGRQYTATEHPRFWHVSADYASAQTNVSVQATPGSGVALYITDIMISNGATAGNITLLNGSGGTVLFEIYPGINGGVVVNLKNPIKLSDNTALCLTSTTVTTHTITVGGFID